MLLALGIKFSHWASILDHQSLFQQVQFLNFILIFERLLTVFPLHLPLRYQPLYVCFDLASFVWKYCLLAASGHALSKIFLIVIELINEALQIL